MTQNVNPDPVPPTPTPPGAAPVGGTPFSGLSPATAAAYEGPAPEQDARTMGMLAHILGIMTVFVGPLIVWLVKKDTSPFVNDQGKESLNWQITLAIGYVGLGIASFIALKILWIFGCLLYLVLIAMWAMNLIFCIQGAMAANRGVAYRYPFSLRLVR